MEMEYEKQVAEKVQSMQMINCIQQISALTAIDKGMINLNRFTQVSNIWLNYTYLDIGLRDFSTSLGVFYHI